MSLADILTPRICELGKIKIGGKEQRERTTASGAKWRAPEKHDHFTVTTMHRAPNGDMVADQALMAKLVERYGDPDGKLRQIPIAFLSDDPEDVLQSRWVAYAGKTLMAKCEDGKTLWEYVDPKTKRPHAEPKALAWKDEYADLKDARGASAFKLHSTLACVIAAEDARWGGVYRFRTTSRISGDQLYGSILQIKELTRGVLRGMPLRLVVRPIQVAPDGKPTTVYVVHVELRGADIVAIQRQALEAKRAEVDIAGELRAVDTRYRALLRAWEPENETEEEVVDVVSEFHAPPVAAEPEAPEGPDPLFDDAPVDVEPAAAEEPPPPEDDNPFGSEPISESARAQLDGENVMRGRFVKHSTQTGTNKSGPWTLHRFFAEDGIEYGTFSASMAEFLLANDGATLRVDWELSKRGNRMIVEARAA